MQYVIDQPKNYSDLDSLRHDLASMDVRETPVFRLEQMRLTTQGTLNISGIGEFPLTEIALRDALRRGGFHLNTSENYFSEKKEALDQVIVDAANAYYRHSKYATQEVKIITRADENHQRIILGIPSARYALLSHETAVEKVLPKIPDNLELSRCNLYPEYLEISLTNPLNPVRDAVGEIVSSGVSILNSQGTRTRALIVACFALRRVCVNGATACDKIFSLKYPHRGDMLNGNGEFIVRITGILQKFSDMMKNLPRLGSIAVTDKFISQIRSDLTDTLGVKETTGFIEGIDRETDTVMQVWNRITNLPHHIKSPERKLKLENLGFKVLTMYLN